MNHEDADRRLPGTASEDTVGAAYTARLVGLSEARWKQVLHVQAPYHWNHRRLLGDRRVLDVGCGIGRNLRALSPRSVGVDHNVHSVEHCRSLGLQACTVEEFETTTWSEPFEGMLVAHVIEHLDPGGEADVLTMYLPHLAPGSPVVLICPQERGFASDATHTTFFDTTSLGRLAESVGLTVQRETSFPFPRRAGKAFIYNESVLVATTPV